jgi:hypothetical protein
MKTQATPTRRNAGASLKNQLKFKPGVGIDADHQHASCILYFSFRILH